MSDKTGGPAKRRDRLMEAVDAFAAEMKRKLRQKRAEGFAGWDDDYFVTNGLCIERLTNHVRRMAEGEAQEVDVANLAMFSWHYRKRQEEKERREKGEKP